MRWLVLILLVALVALVVTATAQNVGARAVTMCGSINIPLTKGKCRMTTVVRFGNTYKIRVCL